VAVVVAWPAAAPAAPVAGTTTLDQRIVGVGPISPFRLLGTVPGEPYTVRQEGIGTASPGRIATRESLLYFGQLADFQLADEESPARVEILDPASDGLPFTAAWRPWEALMPQTVDAAIRQVNSFVPASPVPDGDGGRAQMELAVTSGDSADSQQRNETEWVVRLLEGGPINPNSGSTNTNTWDPLCRTLGLLGLVRPAEAPRYTGIQDYNDYFEGPAPAFYDPNQPRGKFAAWPRYPGLMDRAQATFTTPGLAVPSYVAFGNHDGLVQGNAFANVAYEAVAMGCLKPMLPTFGPGDLAGTLGALTLPNLIGSLQSQAGNVALVPPDPKRQFVDKAQYKALHRTGAQADAHGFNFVDPAQNTASRGSAGYYAWTPKPGLRFITLDTVSEAGVIGPSADGNIDHPQYLWLERELQAATAANQLVVLNSHHAIPSLTANIPDELAPPCVLFIPARGHDVNAGCDRDPRSSSPVHTGASMTQLLHRYPHVVAWVAGHSHVNSVQAFTRPGGGFWSIRSAAEADWPQQSRLIEIFDNNDGTLSIFGTVLDHAADTAIPPSGTPAAAFSPSLLASASRNMSYNDTQEGGNPQFGAPAGEGAPRDRNVELLIADPR
jgi:metallophosphoesterase (TIGR03767 family)